MLIGTGALANHHDVPGRARRDFEHWHDREHLPERVGVPGFLRGRRYRAVDGAAPDYFILYETADVEVLRSAPYVARLDDPTPCTARASATMTRTLRTAARVRASAGRGAGGLVLVARLYPGPGGAPMAPRALAAATPGPGICGVHVLEADRAITGVETRERTLRDPPDECVPWTVLLEGGDGDALAAAWERTADGVPGGVRVETGRYALQTMFSLCDL